MILFKHAFYQMYLAVLVMLYLIFIFAMSDAVAESKK